MCCALEKDPTRKGKLILLGKILEADIYLKSDVTALTLSLMIPLLPFFIEVRSTRTVGHVLANGYQTVIKRRYPPEALITLLVTLRG